MKQIFKLIIAFILVFSTSLSISGAEFGAHPERAVHKYEISPGKKLNIRAEPSTKGALIYQLKPGDVVYIEDETLYDGSGYQWVKIADKWGKKTVRDGYVTNLDRFIQQENPLYDPPTEEQKKIEDAVEHSQTIAKWVLLILSLIAAALMIGSYLSEDAKEKIIGKEVDGMRKTFFFNIAPYRFVIYLSLMLIGAIVVSIIVMLLLGGAVFVLLWIVKILCYIIMWVGIIGCILCIIGCIGGAWVCIIGVVIGGIIWYYSDQITTFGEYCANMGLEFFNEFNIIAYTVQLLNDYWEPALMIVCLPLAIFLGLAILWMLIAGILIGYEKIVTSRYNIKHPCPHCQQPSEPATYLSLGDGGYEELPNDIQLRPGPYGLFHITHPHTNEKMPTMIINGRDRLARYCGNCGKRIKAIEGTEVHVALVGSPQSGKSTLTYRMIAEIFRKAGEDRVEFTDVKNTIKDQSLKPKIQSIAEKGKIEEADLPAKTTTNDIASTQLIIKRQHSSVPYRLFINDVGGELFDPNHQANGHNSTRYFRNVDSILLVIDPLTTDFSDNDPSKRFSEWLKEHAEEGVGKLPVSDMQATIDNQMEKHGRNFKNVHLNIILPKKDLGYIPSNFNLQMQDDMKEFVEQEMGLGSLMHWAQKFGSVNVYAVGAVSEGEKSNISSIMRDIITGQLGIKM